MTKPAEIPCGEYRQSPRAAAGRKFEVDVERAAFLSVLHRLMVSGLDLVFLDSTSVYFEGQREEHFGRRGFRPDLHQMVVGALLDGKDRPICSEMWPGSTTDVTTLIPEVERSRSRFGIGRFWFVADLGMISAGTLN